MNKRLLFVYNPRSGRGMISQHLVEIIDIFTKGGYDVIAHPTQAAGDAEEIVKRYSSEVDSVVCSGGDGTLDEVINGVMKTSPSIAVGYIPAGSTNDFANSLSIPKDMIEAAQDIVAGDIYQCDVGAFNEGYFSYVAAFGMFTNVSYETDQTLKNVIGHLAYVLEAGKQVFNVPSYHLMVTADGRRIEGNYAYGMITNSRLVGGMRNITGKEVDMNDGLFEVTLVHTPTNLIDINEIIQSLLNVNEKSRLVEKFKARRITIESAENIAWTLDGEFGNSHNFVIIENRHRELHLFLNRNRRRTS